MKFTPSLDGLKALAQPRRLQIMERLATHGPATSATLARALDLNTGATSYHLRELARHGFVEETAAPGDTPDSDDAPTSDDTRGPGRERWWRAVSGDLRLPPRSAQDARTRPVVDEMNRLAYAADLRHFEQLQSDSDESELGAWLDAFPYSRSTLRLTLDELHELFEEYIALLNRYQRPERETPAGARTVLARFLAFPAPADPPEGPPDVLPEGPPDVLPEGPPDVQPEDPPNHPSSGGQKGDADV